MRHDSNTQPSNAGPGLIDEAIAYGVDEGMDQQAELEGADLTAFDPRRLGASAVLPCEIWEPDVRARFPQEEQPDEFIERGTQESLDELGGLHEAALAVVVPAGH